MNSEELIAMQRIARNHLRDDLYFQRVKLEIGQAGEVWEIAGIEAAVIGIVSDISKYLAGEIPMPAWGPLEGRGYKGSNNG